MHFRNLLRKFLKVSKILGHPEGINPSNPPQGRRPKVFSPNHNPGNLPWSSSNVTRGVARILFRDGNILWGRPREGPGGRSPPDARNFSNISNNFLRISAKMHYFRLFTQNFTNPALIFRAFWRKTQIVGKFLKFFDENSIENVLF